MNENIDKNAKFLTPFKYFCMTIGELPSSYVESLSYYEMLVWFTNYLSQTVIPTVNNNAEALKEVQDLFLELQDYVNNYFSELNVQTEINNKLDDMAESGQLVEIISLYLNSSCVLAFDTVSDMIEAENLIDGSICKTLGKNTFNDGFGAFYKVRTITENDTIDDDYIVGLDVSETLIAERIIEQDKPRKIIILGDSYANRTNSWADRLQTALELSNNDCVIKRESGVGFYNTSDSKNFTTMVVDNIPLNPIEVTDIIVCGGYNDYYVSEVNLANAFNTFVTTCKTTYPNAKIHVGFIGWLTPEIGTATEYGNLITGMNTTRERYIRLCSEHSNTHYLNNVEYALHDIGLLDETHFHPTNDGQAKLCELIKQAFETGSCNNNSLQKNVTSSFDISDISYITAKSGSWYSLIDNGISRLFTNGNILLTFDETTTINLQNDIQIGSLLDGYVQGRSQTVTSCMVSALVNTKDNGYFMVPAILYISDGNLKLRCRTLNAERNNWVNDELKYIELSGVNLICDSMLQY